MTRTRSVPSPARSSAATPPASTATARGADVERLVVEIAAFNEFTAVLAAPQQTEQFDHVLFDTAPTGHTLRLLTLPSAWSGYVDEHPSGASCLGPLAGLDQQREQYAAAVKILADPKATTLVLLAPRERRAGRKPHAPAASSPPWA